VAVAVKMIMQLRGRVNNVILWREKIVFPPLF
jgi:hypothetical protein